jgi:SAM-dependent methyltransferase
MSEPPRIDICAQYDRIAEWFDNNRSKSGPLAEMPFLEAIAADVAPEGHVLDLGCGSGEPIAAWFIERGFRVTGIDGSAAMIALCRARFPGMNWVIRDMRRIKLDRVFQVVVAWDSFFHLSPDEQPDMFAVFAAHTAPGGMLLFTTGPGAGTAHGVMNGLDFTYGSLSADDYKSLLTANGFTLVLHQTGEPALGEHTIWLARRDGEPEPPREYFIPED